MQTATRDNAILVLDKSLGQIDQIIERPWRSEEAKQWKHEAKARLCNLFGENSRQVKEFDNQFKHIVYPDKDEAIQKLHAEDMAKARALLNALKTEVEDFWD